MFKINDEYPDIRRYKNPTNALNLVRLQLLEVQVLWSAKFSSGNIVFGTVEQNKKGDVPRRLVLIKASWPLQKWWRGSVKLIKCYRTMWPLFPEVRLNVKKNPKNVPYRFCPYRMLGDLRYEKYRTEHNFEYRSVLACVQKRLIVVKNALAAVCSS